MACYSSQHRWQSKFAGLRSLNMKRLLVLLVCLDICSGKKLIYNLMNDDRKEFTLSTFGFLQNGTLNVNITGFSFRTQDGHYPDKPMFGFTLEKGKIREDRQDTCIPASTGMPASEVLFTIDHVHSRLMVTSKKYSIANLVITDQDRSEFLLENHLHHRDVAGDNDPTTKVADSGNEDKNVSNLTGDKQIKSSEMVRSEGTTSADVLRTFQLKQADRVFTGHFLVAITSKDEEGLYNLFFHNCQNYGKNPAEVNLSLEITEDNNGNYLSAGEMPEPALYFTFSMLFFIMGCVWLSVLKKSDVGKIHFLMLSVAFATSLCSMLHGVNSYFIQVTGHHEKTWAILHYIAHLFKGVLMFVTILLIGAGWGFIKHMLSRKEKIFFLIVILLQVPIRVAWVIVEESEEGQVSFTTWKTVFIFFDLLCCGAMLFPIVWTIAAIMDDLVEMDCAVKKRFCCLTVRQLKEKSKTDERAALNLNKLKLFRQFYMLVVCYIFFTRIILCLLKINLSFKLVWLTLLFEGLATLIFFVVTGYKFRPASDDPYLQVPQDSDDEVELEEVLTHSGVTEGLVKVKK